MELSEKNNVQVASVYEDPNRLGRWLQVTLLLGKPTCEGGAGKHSMYIRPSWRALWRQVYM
jgi:hypothetical protein